eukprot:Phypoly_transcript_18842.p1 GENE.Phypoly_transcript_18842~~Phypoly_transcript_18842.p1  ORF type:complete len:197 (+),score=33.45 Phypoly_transcript_18842:142-732(+)
MTEHIDAARLDTDLEYRFNYMTKFLDFGAEDIELIKGTAPNLGPLVPTVVEAVYTKLFSFDVTKNVFAEHTGADGADFQHTNDSMLGRKDFLTKYLVKLVTGAYDLNFVKYLDYVGKIHTAASTRKAGPISVDYIHVGLLFGYVETLLIGAIKTFGYPADKENKTIAAFNKLLWLQNDLFTRWYIQASKAEAPKTN